MRIVICDSKNWFKLDAKLCSSKQVKFITKREELTQEFLDGFRPRYIFFVHWNWMVQDEIYSKYECIVFHTAPLPYGRGGSPIQNLILNGFSVSPVCALRMTGDLDAGPIYAKKEISLQGSLTQIFSHLSDAINELITKITGETIVPIEQVGDVYVFKRLEEKDNELPENIGLKQIYDRIRMLDHNSYPNAFLIYGDMKLEFYNAECEDDIITVSCRISKCS